MHIPETLHTLLKSCILKMVSDLHISVGTAPLGRVNGKLTALDDAIWTAEKMAELIQEALTVDEKITFDKQLSLDSACSLGETRFRINIYKERGHSAWAIRRLEDQIKTVQELNLPSQLIDFAELNDGLVLFTGPTGSGKSTSLATLLNHINIHRCEHILTIEDPIEYIHHNKKSLVHQREIGRDVTTFSNSLREALREDPDVILVGEMRDLDTIRAALTAAETGHLVFSTLHSADTVGALDRILAMYPAEEQDSVRRQVSMVLKGIVAQRLIPKAEGKGRCAAVEILKINSAVANLIRTEQFAQIYSVLETSQNVGMQSFDQALAQLVHQEEIDEETAKPLARSQQYFSSALENLLKNDRLADDSLSSKKSASPKKATSLFGAGLK